MTTKIELARGTILEVNLQGIGRSFTISYDAYGKSGRASVIASKPDDARRTGIIYDSRFNKQEGSNGTGTRDAVVRFLDAHSDAFESDITDIFMRLSRTERVQSSAPVIAETVSLTQKWLAVDPDSAELFGNSRFDHYLRKHALYFYSLHVVLDDPAHSDVNSSVYSRAQAAATGLLRTARKAPVDDDTLYDLAP